MPKTRIGKTDKDRKNGAFARNASNKRERAEYQLDVMMNPRAHHVFPIHTCNGKKNKPFKK
jgi:hypothetical protein